MVMCGGHRRVWSAQAAPMAATSCSPARVTSMPGHTYPWYLHKSSSVLAPTGGLDCAKCMVHGTLIRHLSEDIASTSPGSHTALLLASTWW